MLGAVDNDAASSAQSKCAESGEMACLGLNRGEPRCTGGNRGIDSEQGLSAVVDGIINDMAGVSDTGGSETSCFGGLWGELGLWDAF